MVYYFIMAGNFIRYKVHAFLQSPYKLNLHCYGIFKIDFKQVEATLSLFCTRIREKVDSLPVHRQIRSTGRGLRRICGWSRGRSTRCPSDRSRSRRTNSRNVCRQPDRQKMLYVMWTPACYFVAKLTQFEIVITYKKSAIYCLGFMIDRSPFDLLQSL